MSELDTYVLEDCREDDSCDYKYTIATILNDDRYDIDEEIDVDDHVHVIFIAHTDQKTCLRQGLPSDDDDDDNDDEDDDIEYDPSEKQYASVIADRVTDKDIIQCASVKIIQVNEDGTFIGKMFISICVKIVEIEETFLLKRSNILCHKSQCALDRGLIEAAKILNGVYGDVNIADTQAIEMYLKLNTIYSKK